MVNIPNAEYANLVAQRDAATSALEALQKSFCLEEVGDDTSEQAAAKRQARAVLKEYSTAPEEPHPAALALVEQART
ncbi:hypothetical protein ACR3H8_30095 [Pseudomonas aeruginosa]|uniref:Uncharacterized protein n=3 Tax=Pseudomonas TaxID=286 RepID=A0A223Q486_PSEPU|nr:MULTISPECIES: hypothetical protein [Pseudomonas]WQN30298.1 hypothetical protein ULE26_22270 [Stutzerimonas stutzeri]AJA17208.1 hypothetical protein RPPX_28190 [Pseudomonas putida S12]ANP63393.1 hypothetical protein A9P90_31560 [Pseudomonas aeruginosa]ARD70472.1 Hypothetical protein [Pseudomonas aeruginosa]ASU52433.1 Hypothetical protein [Pseudomonas putida]